MTILNIARLNKELTAIQLEKSEWVKSLESSKTELEKVKEEKAAMESKLEELTKKLEEMEAKHQEAKKEEAAVIIAVEESVNKKVVQNLAAIGVQEGLIKEEVVASTPNSKEVYTKYESLNGKEKIEFFKANEKTILKEMKAFHFQVSPVGANQKQF
jgi:septal ring factor EnvC (AmiA/AmiB activator)